jgi:hypothetical protein
VGKEKNSEHERSSEAGPVSVSPGCDGSGGVC